MRTGIWLVMLLFGMVVLPGVAVSGPKVVGGSTVQTGALHPYVVNGINAPGYLQADTSWNADGPGQVTYDLIEDLPPGVMGPPRHWPSPTTTAASGGIGGHTETLTGPPSGITVHLDMTITTASGSNTGSSNSIPVP